MDARDLSTMDAAASFDIRGRTVLVTGASSGLGRTFALGLAARGAVLFACARRTDLLRELTAVDDRVTAVQGDVTNPADRERLVATALERTGAIDVLVNNAGISNYGPAESESLEDFNRVLDVNLGAAFALMQLVGARMLEAGSGSIINISSVLGLGASAPIPAAAYCASKAALVNLTREVGAQWARRGVRVNALAPGFFPSEMTGELTSDTQSSRYLTRRIPMGRLGRPEELLGALTFLASDASSYVTGQTLAVDGGWTAT